MAVSKQYGTKKIRREALWTYWAGCCWTKIREINARAQQLIDSGVV